MSLLLVLFQLFWRLPKRTPGRPWAERLGRSAGSRQNNCRAADLVLRQTLLRHPVVPLFPRMACRGWSPAVGYRHLARLVRLGPLRPYCNLLPAQLLSSIPDLQPPVLPLADHHLSLRRRLVISLPVHLQKPILVPHHPVVADHPFRLQPEDLIQRRLVRLLVMIVLRRRCRMREAPVVVRQVFALQILVGALIAPDVLAPQFLHQPVLVSPVVPLHPSFGLRGIGRDDSNPQPLAHPPKPRQGRLAAQELLLGRLFDIDGFPVCVQSHRYSVFLDPTPQHSRRRPDRLLGSHRRQCRGGGVIHQVHQAAFRPPLFEPLVEAPVHLYQFAKLHSRLPPLPVRSPFPHPAPQSFSQHPAPQRLRVNLDPILTSQMLACQRRPESFPHLSRVFLAHQSQHFQAKLFRLLPAGLPPHATMPQSLRTLLLISPPNPLRLAVTQAEDRRRVYQVQGFLFNPSQHSCPSQFFAAHRCPLQSDLLQRSSDCLVWRICG